MKRTILQWTTVIALAAGYALTVAGQVQIHPPGGALGGPIARLPSCRITI